MRTAELSPEPSLQEIVLARVLPATAVPIVKRHCPVRQPRVEHVKMAGRSQGPPGIAGALVILAIMVGIVKR